MSSNYPGNPANNPANITIPDDLDPEVASFVATALEQLADRTARLNAVMLPAAGGAVTGLIQAINGGQFDDSNQPNGGVPGFISDLSGTAGQKKIVQRFNTGGVVNGVQPFFSLLTTANGTTGQAELVQNASWDPVAKLWSYTDPAVATAIRQVITGSAITIQQYQGAGPTWADGAWSTRAQLGSTNGFGAVFGTSDAASAAVLGTNGAGGPGVQGQSQGNGVVGIGLGTGGGSNGGRFTNFGSAPALFAGSNGTGNGLLAFASSGGSAVTGITQGGLSNGQAGVTGSSQGAGAGVGVAGFCDNNSAAMYGTSTGSGEAVVADSSNGTGYALYINGSPTCASGHIVPINVLPATCNPGDFTFHNDGSGNFYFDICLSPNTWKQVAIVP